MSEILQCLKHNLNEYIYFPVHIVRSSDIFEILRKFFKEIFNSLTS